MSLRDATSHTHHDAEHHVWGQRLASGTLSREEYAAWIGAMLEIHRKLDQYLPPCLQRGGAFLLDACELKDVNMQKLLAVDTILFKMHRSLSYVGGLAYIVCGANLRGGQVIKKTLEPLGFPCNHTVFHDFKEPNMWLSKFNEIDAIAADANEAFEDIIKIMDEIYRSVTRIQEIENAFVV